MSAEKNPQSDNSPVHKACTGLRLTNLLRETYSLQLARLRTVDEHWDLKLFEAKKLSLLHAGLRSRSRKESEVFGWSRIPNNTRSWSRIFCPAPDVQMDHFLHHTPKLVIPVEVVQFLLKLWLKQRFLAVYHDFHWSSQPIFHSLYVKESEILGRSEWDILEWLESDILPPTPQPWLYDNFENERTYVINHPNCNSGKLRMMPISRCERFSNKFTPEWHKTTHTYLKINENIADTLFFRRQMGIGTIR